MQTVCTNLKGKYIYYIYVFLILKFFQKKFVFAKLSFVGNDLCFAIFFFAISYDSSIKRFYSSVLHQI